MRVNVPMKTAESILKTLHQPVLVLDRTLRPLIANPAFYHTFGLASTDLDQRFINAFVFGKGCEPPLRVVLESIIKNQSDVQGVETLCTLNSGKQIVLMVNARRIHTDALPEMILIEPRDITKEKKTELRIQELNEALQAHVAAVDAVNKELESFSHSVSHDLRTPLRFVNRIAHLLLHEPGAQLSGGAAQQVDMILQATSEMAKLIENLLVFSQVGREPIRKRRVDLRRIFQEVVKDLRHAQECCNAEIVIENLAPCQGERTLLKEVAVNLLANAIKFTRRREKAQITIGCTQTMDAIVYFVQDNGVGFDTADTDSLFIPFHRLHKPADFEGTGIGLALVKRIIEGHGGRVWAVGEVNKGATFYFTLGKEAAE